MQNHQADNQLYVWPDVWSADLHLFIKNMVIHDIECPYWDQMSLNNTNQTKPFLSMGVINFMLCPIQAGSNSTCSIDHNNIIHALSRYYIWMMRIYYEYVTIIAYATRYYYDAYDLITNSLRHYCGIMTLPIPLRSYFTCNRPRETFHERWRMPRTWPNLVGMQVDIRKNVSDSTTNLCELKTMGYIVSS